VSAARFHPAARAELREAAAFYETRLEGLGAACRGWDWTSPCCANPCRHEPQRRRLGISGIGATTNIGARAPLASLRDIGSGEEPVRDAKDPLDALWIAHADLHMSFFMKPGIRVDRFPFNEDSLDRVDGRLVRIAAYVVERPYHRAVQISSQTIGIVFRQGKFRRFVNFNETLVSGANLSNSSSARQIEAQAKFDDSTDDTCLVDTSLAPFEGSEFRGEVQTALRVGFPEVYAGTEPVVVVVAGLEVFAGQEAVRRRLDRSRDSQG